jgi:hypothetical protein
VHGVDWKFCIAGSGRDRFEGVLRRKYSSFAGRLTKTVAGREINATAGSAVISSSRAFSVPRVSRFRLSRMRRSRVRTTRPIGAELKNAVVEDQDVGGDEKECDSCRESRWAEDGNNYSDKQLRKGIEQDDVMSGASVSDACHQGERYPAGDDREDCSRVLNTGG